MKLGNKVKLTKKAIKEFYGRPERIEDFSVGGNLENLSSSQVLDFIDSYLGFENGQNFGYVVGIRGGTVEVNYMGTISQKVDYMFYDKKDLKIVR